MIVAGTFADWWVYLAAPLVGGVLGASVGTQLLHAERVSA